MKIERTTQDGVTILAPQGSLDATSAPEAEQAFSAALSDGATCVLLDLSGVEYISSGGIRSVIMLEKAIKKASGRLALCGLSPFVREVLEVTNLARIFAVYENREEAVRALESPA